MTRTPQGPREPGLGADLDETQEALARYASETADYPSRQLAERVMQAVEAEPLPRRGLLAALFPSRSGGASGPMRLALVVATVMAAAVLALAAGGISQLLLRNVGSSASPAVTQSAVPASSDASLTPTPTPTPSATPASPSAPGSSSPSEDGSSAPSQAATPSASQSDDHESETAKPSATPRPSDTPRPSETPHSDG